MALSYKKAKKLMQNEGYYLHVIIEDGKIDKVVLRKENEEETLTVQKDGGIKISTECYIVSREDNTFVMALENEDEF